MLLRDLFTYPVLAFCNIPSTLSNMRAGPVS
jgi:hypothetical protein